MYVNGRRSTAAFIASDYVAMGINNDHTETRTERITPERFGFFDRNALDAGRFIYGTLNAVVTAHEGDQLLDAWLDAADEIDVFAAFDQSTLVIGEGSRNATLSRFAGRVLIRYGQTNQARDLFDRKANLCEPPLSDSELTTIWNSA